MAPTSTKAVDHKKNRPPKFVHLPKDRAKKLKQVWVERQKIKSKWKAQKRREGLVTGPPSRPTPNSGNANEDEGIDGSDESENASEENSIELEDASEPHQRGPAAHPSGWTLKPQPKARPPSAGRDSSKSKDESDDKGRLRELRRQAYAPASLHRHKSDPLHKHKQERRRDAHGDRRGAVQHGGERHSNRNERDSRKPRGQPDMRLRMNVMLEKIKRDLV